MKRSEYITIPKPCHENWSEMKPVDKGRFCASCQKKVYDFTQAPDTAILEIIRKSQDVCGRFRVSQLERKLIEPTQKSSVWAAGASGVLGLLSAASTQAQESEKPKTVIVLGESSAIKTGEVVVQGDTIYGPIKKWIDGVVTDDAGPLPSAAVRVGTKGVMTDIDGKFRIEATVGDTLTASFIGFDDVVILVAEQNTYTLKMAAPALTGEIIVMAGGIRRANFFWRTWYRIRDWFR